MTTLISHIYNEEFLLPFFIDHHYAKFDKGIILDYGSTDGSLEILKKLAPNWSIINCSDEIFDAGSVDSLVHSYEEETSGVCLILTVTEFFIGDPRFVSRGMVLPTYSFLRTIEEPEIKHGEKFHEIYKHGVSPFHIPKEFSTEWLLRKKGRKIKSTKEVYPIGRHFDILGQTPFLVYRVANCLASKEMIERRLQIQKRIPTEDVELGFGVQHTNYGKGLDLASLLATIDSELLVSEDISLRIAEALQLENLLKDVETNSPVFFVIKDLISHFEFNQKVISDLLNDNLKVNLELATTRNDLATTRNDLATTRNDLGELRDINKDLIIDTNHKLGIYAEEFSSLEDLLKSTQQQFKENEIASSHERQLLSLQVDFLVAQSKRPTYNLSQFLNTFLPAIRVRLRKMLK
jgi:hypothetical protein